MGAPPASRDGDPGGRPTPERVHRPCVVLRLGADVDMGPGRADLLDAVGRVGSISGAARAVGMSYRKAWRLIDQMNHAFRDPVVETVFGGSRGGGASLTETGRTVLEAYRAIERKSTATAREDIDILRRLALGTPA